MRPCPAGGSQHLRPSGLHSALWPHWWRRLPRLLLHGRRSRRPRLLQRSSCAAAGDSGRCCAARSARPALLLLGCCCCCCLRMNQIRVDGLPNLCNVSHTDGPAWPNAVKSLPGQAMSDGALAYVRSSMGPANSSREAISSASRKHHVRSKIVSRQSPKPPRAARRTAHVQWGRQPHCVAAAAPLTKQEPSAAFDKLRDLPQDPSGQA